MNELSKIFKQIEEHNPEMFFEFKESLSRKKIDELILIVKHKPDRNNQATTKWSFSFREIFNHD